MSTSSTIHSFTCKTLPFSAMPGKQKGNCYSRWRHLPLLPFLPVSSTHAYNSSCGPASTRPEISSNIWDLQQSPFIYHLPARKLVAYLGPCDHYTSLTPVIFR